MLKQIRRANETLKALPGWLKIVIAVQCLIPGVILRLQVKYLTFSSIELGQIVDVFTKTNEQSSTILNIMQVGQQSTDIFRMLVWLNCGLAVFGLAILCLMFWNSKNTPELQSVTNMS